jgi:hypothetical protein
MNLRLAVFGLAMTSVLLSEQAIAQTYGNQLRGINQISLLIEPLDEDQKECQLTEALIHDAFMYPASGARFVIVKEAIAVPKMYFNITTLFFRQNQVCFSNVDIRLQVHQEARLETSGRSILATILLWNVSSVRSSVRGRHAQPIREAIEEATKKFVTDWNLDNK